MSKHYKVALVLLSFEATHLILNGLIKARELNVDRTNDLLIQQLTSAVKKFRPSAGDTKIAFEGTSHYMTKLVAGIGYYTVYYGCTQHYSTICSTVASAKALLDYHGGITIHHACCSNQSS